jgi:hypothetical protein
MKPQERFTNMNRYLLTSAIAAAALVALPATAQAGPPTDPPCVGEFFSANATQFGRAFAGQLSFLARNPEVLPNADNFGEGIQNLQDGTAVLFQACP